MHLPRLLVCTLLLWVAASPAFADAFQDERDRLLERAVERLYEVAKWCDGERLHASRNSIARDLLHFDPEHAKARRWLGFKKRKGEWQPPRRPLDAEDFDGPAIAELPDRRRSAVEGSAEMLLALAETHRDEIGAVRFDALVRDLTHLLPDEKRYRDLAGEVLTGGQWLLTESEHAARHPDRLRKLAAAALAEVPAAEEGENTAFERSLGLRWTATRFDDRVRVTGTTELEELAEIRRLVSSTATYLPQALGVDTKLRRDYTVVSLAAPAEAEKYLAHHEAVDQAYRDYAKQLVGVWVGDLPIVLQYGKTRARRQDGSVRQAVFAYLIDAFKIGYQHGWVAEGVGLRLTHAVTGTRLTWFIAPSRYQAADKQLAERMHDPHTDWIAVARSVIEKRGGPDLAQVLQLPTNAMGPEETLIAYAFADYLLEGRPQEAAELLRETGRAEKPEEAVKNALGIELPSLEVRFVRWLHEVR